MHARTTTGKFRFARATHWVNRIVLSPSGISETPPARSENAPHLYT